MGGLIIFAAICDPLPGPLRPRRRRAWPSSASRSAAPRSASPTTSSRSSSAARSGSRRAGSCSSRSSSRSASGGSRATRSASSRCLELRIGDASSTSARSLYFVLVFLVIAGASQRRQPHRRPRRPRRRLLRDRPARLHGDHLRHQRAAGPGAALGLPGRRLHRLPLVQRLPGLDLHGGHRLARAWAARSGRWR